MFSNSSIYLLAFDGNYLIFQLLRAQNYMDFKIVLVTVVMYRAGIK